MSIEIRPSGFSLPTMNSVEPPPTSTTRYGVGSCKPAVAPRNDSAASSSPESSSGRTPRSASVAGSKKSSRLRASRDALVAVSPHPRGTESFDDLPVLAQHRDRALDRVGSQRAIGVDARAQSGDAHLALDRRGIRVGTVPVDVGDEQAGGVGTDVDGGDAASSGCLLFGETVRDPLADGVVTAGEEVRVVGVQALHSGAGAADTTVRTRALVVGGKRGVAFVGVRRVRRTESVRVDRRFGRAHSAGRPRHGDTRRTRSGSTSQYRVGIGVPSSSSGALRMTAGPPSAERVRRPRTRPAARARAAR